jgi:hypothetical protein
MHSPVWRRVLWSAAVSPLAVVPASIPVALWSKVGARPTTGLVSESLDVILITSLYALAFAYAAMLVLGIPAAVLALKFRLVSLPAAVVAGSMTGVVVGLALWRGHTEIGDLATMAWYGIAISACFWLLFRQTGATDKVSASQGAA